MTTDTTDALARVAARPIVLDPYLRPIPDHRHDGRAPLTPAEALDAAIDALAGRRIVALTGAGISTDSGIPDYRGPGKPIRTPMTHGEFCSSPAAQRHYWARSHLGWQRLGHARPNDGHRALATLAARGAVPRVITQNVDGLHQQAGSPVVVDLHGRIDRVVCLGCADVSGRAALHDRLDALNPTFVREVAGADAMTKPDGDVDLADTSRFRIAPCGGCGGALKPDVVFFGDNVPRDRVDQCYRWVDEADALLVAGSSLTVMSGLRFVRHAAKRAIPVVIINRGATRGDPLATVKLDAGCSGTLRALAVAL